MRKNRNDQLVRHVEKGERADDDGGDLDQGNE